MRCPFAACRRIEHVFLVPVTDRRDSMVPCPVPGKPVRRRRVREGIDSVTARREGEARQPAKAVKVGVCPAKEDWVVAVHVDVARGKERLAVCGWICAVPPVVDPNVGADSVHSTRCQGAGAEVDVLVSGGGTGTGTGHGGPQPVRRQVNAVAGRVVDLNVLPRCRIVGAVAVYLGHKKPGHRTDRRRCWLHHSRLEGLAGWCGRG